MAAPDTTITPPAPAGNAPAPAPAMGRLAGASMVGTTLEWYDFTVYNTMAALVFNRLFFPSFDPIAGAILAFSTYAVGYLSRPARRYRFRSPRRQARPPRRALRHPGRDGRDDGGDGPAADLRRDRRAEPHPARRAALRAGDRARRGMGRRRAAGDGARAAGPARPQRLLGADGPLRRDADRDGGHRAHHHHDEQRALPRVGMAPALHRQRRPRRLRPVGARRRRGNAGVQGAGSPARQGGGAGRRRPARPLAPLADRRRLPGGGGRPLRFDGRVHPHLRDGRPAPVPHPGVDRRAERGRRQRPHDPARRRAVRPLRAPPGLRDRRGGGRRLGIRGCSPCSTPRCRGWWSWRS